MGKIGADIAVEGWVFKFWPFETLPFTLPTLPQGS